MKKFLKIAGIILFILILLGFSAKKILLDYSSVPDKSDITLTAGELRDLAGNTGPLPVKINVLRVGVGEFLPGMVVAGERNKKYSAPFFAYQVVYGGNLPGGGNTVIIDAAMDRSQTKMMKGDVQFDDAAYGALQKGMKKAAAIILTHEHFDHAGGIAKSPFFGDIMGKTLFTDEQMASPIILEAGFTGDMLAKCKKLTYDRVHVLFPGMVLVKTPGHTPGHQMVYVKLENGGEYLIAGDIAWHTDNITLLKQRPVIVSLFLGENRGNVGNQLRWLHDLTVDHSEIHVLVYHDKAQHDGLVKGGLLGRGFEF